jgi:hypothetical protein
VVAKKIAQAFRLRIIENQAGSSLLYSGRASMLGAWKLSHVSDRAVLRSRQLAARVRSHV